MGDRSARPGGDIRAYRNSFIGMAALACTLFLIFATWPLYGAAGAIPQFVIWSVLFVLGCRAFTRNPTWVLSLGLVSVAVYAGYVVAWK